MQTRFVVLFGIAVFSHASAAMTLEQAVNRALTTNPRVLSARERTRQAGALIWERIAPPDPTVFIEAGGIPNDKNADHFLERKTGVSQSFSFPLVYWYRGKEQYQEKLQWEAEIQLIQKGLRSEVVKTFYRILLMQKEEELAGEMLSLTETVMKKARIRVLSGESAAYDTLKARVDLAEAKNRLLQIRQSLRTDRAELARLMGMERLEDDPVGLLKYTPRQWQRDRLQERALSARPEVKQMLFNEESMKTRKKLSLLSLIPDFHVKAFRHSIAGEPEDSRWGGEAGFSVPLWFFMSNQGRIRSARHGLRAAHWEKVAQNQKILLEVEEAFSHLESAQRRMVNFSENTLAEVRELVRIASRSYEEGEMGYIEVAEAMRSMNRIQSGYWESVYACLAAQADLEAAVGESLEP